MKTWKRFPRLLLVLTLLTALGAGMFAPRMESVEAKPHGASLRDVIISEVAWGGTAGDTSGEWIELYNRTNSPINLTNWTIEIADGSPTTITIPSGTIPPNGYFLLERIQSAINNMTADYVYGGSNFSNTSEGLTLKDNIGTTIDTANSGCVNCWFEGSDSPNYFSMERVGFLSDTASDWVSNNGITRNGLDVSNNPINGTPRNSQIDLELSMKMKTIVGSSPPITATFTITVSNKGYGTATNIIVRDLLLVGLTYVTHDPSVGNYDNLTGDWTIGTLPTGSSETLDITVTWGPGGVVSNSAEIFSSDQTDPDSTPNNASIPIVEDDYDSINIGLPILTITNTVNNPTPNVGNNIVFTISVNNPVSASTNATGVAVDALLPEGLTYISHSSTLGTYNGNSGIWTINNLASGGSGTLSITANVSSSAVKTYIADISSFEFGNSSASITVTPIGGQSDLSLTQTMSKAVPGAAGIVVFTITVNNAGPFDATNVEVKDVLPGGLSYISDDSSGTYDDSTGIWTVGSLANLASRTLKITAEVDLSGSTTNQAEVWASDQLDPDSTPGNGTLDVDDDASVDVLIADINVAETVDIAGTNAVFTITVHNAGPDSATGLQIKNLLPALASYAYVSQGSTLGTYDELSGIWTIGTLANGANATLTVTTNIIGPLLSNWAEVFASDQIDPDSVPDNSSRVEDDDAGVLFADLRVEQTVNNANPAINSDVTFTIIVTNDGPLDTAGVQVKDALPAALTYVSSTASVGTYSNLTGVWTVGTLANGANATLTVTAKMSASGTFTNNAEVWASNLSDPDSNPANNSTSEDDDANATVSQIPTPTPTPTPTRTPTGTALRTIIINEVAWAGTGSGAALTPDEWIELYNPGSSPINLAGWKIKDSSSTINLAGTIPAGGYFLLERDDNTTVSDIAADLVYTEIELNNSGETLTLYDPSNKAVDTANGNGGSWPAGSASTYGTMERASITGESDSAWGTNTGIKKNGKAANGADILGTPKAGNTPVPTATPTRVPTATNTPIPPTAKIDPRPILNEILARPGFDWNQDGRADVFDEFIEIKNLSPIDISLNGWKLDKVGGTPFNLPNVTLKPGQHIVLYSGETDLLLSDGGETVRLFNPSGKIFDAYTYTFAREEDKSICRLPDGNVYNGWFEDCTPTPGLANTREGNIPSAPNGGGSPVCELPDTIPSDFFFAECRGVGANIWNPYYWDQLFPLDKTWIRQNTSKWQTFIE